MSQELQQYNDKVLSYNLVPVRAHDSVTAIAYTPFNDKKINSFSTSYHHEVPAAVLFS